MQHHRAFLHCRRTDGLTLQRNSNGVPFQTRRGEAATGRTAADNSLDGIGGFGGKKRFVGEISSWKDRDEGGDPSVSRTGN
jgi:hypothetical protein